MSVVKSNAHQVGQSVTAANNFTLYQPATPDGTVRLGVGNAGATTTDVITASSTGVTIPSVSSSNTFGFKNRIINGGMVIDQRNAGAAVTLSSSFSYTVDRWAANRGGSSTATAQQSSTAPTGFAKSLLYTVGTGASPASDDYSSLRQPIEGNNIADLGWGSASAKSVTLSFWVRSSLTGTFGFVAINGSQAYAYANTYTISVANTWEQKTVVIPGPTSGTWATDNNTGILISFDMGVGSTQSAPASSSWQSGNYLGVTSTTKVCANSGATFYITGVQLEVGSQATSFDFRSYGQELALCQRYYEKLAAGSTAPGGYSFVVTIWSTNQAPSGATWMFKVNKRATPTLTSDTAGMRFVGYGITTGAGTPSFYYITTEGAAFASPTAGSWTVGSGWLDNVGTCAAAAEL